MRTVKVEELEVGMRVEMQFAPYAVSDICTIKAIKSTPEGKLYKIDWDECTIPSVWNSEKEVEILEGVEESDDQEDDDELDIDDGYWYDMDDDEGEDW